MHIDPREAGSKEPTDWSPERKIVGAAVAGLTAWLVQVVSTAQGYPLDFPPGIEASVAVIAAYFIPNKRTG